PLHEFPKFIDEKTFDKDQKIARLEAELAEVRGRRVADEVASAAKVHTPEGADPASAVPHSERVPEPRTGASIVIQGDVRVYASEVQEALENWAFSNEGREVYDKFVGRPPKLSDRELLDA